MRSRLRDRIVASMFCMSCGTQLIPDARYCQACGGPTTWPVPAGEARRSTKRLVAAFVGCAALDVVVSLVAIVWIALAAVDRQSTYGTPGPSNTAGIDGLFGVVWLIVAALAWQALKLFWPRRLPRLVRRVPAAAVAALLFGVGFILLIGLWMPAAASTSSSRAAVNSAGAAMKTSARTLDTALVGCRRSGNPTSYSHCIDHAYETSHFVQAIDKRSPPGCWLGYRWTQRPPRTGVDD
jgi:hypothetical protein